VVIRKVKEAELDEMWSFVGSKQQPRWLWEALDHQTGRRVAYTFGRRADWAVLKLKMLLAPFGIRRFYTDGWDAYRRHLDPRRHVVGKRRTQQLERKQLTFRTRIKRLVRNTICFSKSIAMHAIVIGRFIKRVEFGLQI
jgi:insertion element IS1 protein InsB